MLNYIMLALSVSIDSLGIGITYGLKQTKINMYAKIILFFISFIITSLSVLLGNFISSFLSPTISKIFGSLILICIGIMIIYQVYKPSVTRKKLKTYNILLKSLGITIKIIHDPMYSDLDSSKVIDAKESFYLGLALSLDSIGIGIAGSVLVNNFILFSLFVSSFQLLFLTIGNMLGKTVAKKLPFPDNIWNLISGILLIIIGLSKIC